MEVFIINITTIYERHYTCLKGYRNILKYELCEFEIEDKKIYGAQMVLHTEHSTEVESEVDMFTDEASAKDFIKYLYENSADIVHFKDLAYDYIV